MIQPGRLCRLHCIAENAQLHLHCGKYLRCLIMQLARQTAPLLLVLLDHAGGKPRQLDSAGLEAAVEIGVLQRGADLMPQRKEEAVVQCRERIASGAHEHQRSDHPLSPQNRQDRRVRVDGTTSLAVAPVSTELGPARADHALEHRGA
jgi:hypothetical protein